jgi:phosphopantetheinyl transferase
MLIRDFSPGPGIRLGIWHITETNSELLSMLSLSSSEMEYFRTFSNENRKCQWLACRAILKQFLAPDSSETGYDGSGKPFLVQQGFHISLSHAGNYAVAICSKHGPAGIDIEQMKGRIERVKARFLREDELAALGSDPRIESLYVYWCGKEALYKLNGQPNLDFRNDIYIHSFDYLCTRKGTFKASIHSSDFPDPVFLNYEIMEDYMLVYVHSG